MSLEHYRSAGKILCEKLRLPTDPVAIKYIKSENEIPPGTFRPTTMPMSKKWSLCQAHTYARRWGWHCAMTADDNFCVPGSAMHQWVDVTGEEFIESQAQQGWHMSREAEQNRYDCYAGMFQGPDGEALLAKAKEYIGFVCSPLPNTIVEPDVVTVFGDGSHITHLVHAVCYDYKHPVISSFEGFGESCIKGGFLPFILDRPQVVIPGMGDRAFVGISDHEIAFGLPASRLDELLENLFKTGGMLNIGQPSRQFMAMNLTESITPGFTYLREVVDGKKDR